MISPLAYSYRRDFYWKCGPSGQLLHFYIQRRRAGPQSPNHGADPSCHFPKKGFKHTMQQSYITLPGGIYTFVVIVLLVVTISVLVVWPAVWSSDPSRRQAAYAVLDRILKFFRSTRRR
jgi:hypothetical protein